jgi:hypothetical protein
VAVAVVDDAAAGRDLDGALLLARGLLREVAVADDLEEDEAAADDGRPEKKDPREEEKAAARRRLRVVRRRRDARACLRC